MDSGSERGGRWAIAAAARVTALMLAALYGVMVEVQKDA